MYENCGIDEDGGESDRCFCSLVMGRRRKDDEQGTLSVREGVYDMSMISGLVLTCVIHVGR